MRRSFRLTALLLCGLAAPCLAPSAFAQSDEQEPPAAPAGKGGERSCMMQHLPQMTADMREHMKAFRSGNPDASKDQMAAERRGYMKTLRSQHPQDVAAARRACAAAPG